MKKSIYTALFASTLLCSCSTPSVYNAISENGEVSMEKFHEEIQKGADVNEYSSFERPFPLITFESTEACQTLIEKGADVKAYNEKYDMSVLMGVAAFSQNPEKIDLLIKNGADINERSKTGRSPIIFAAQMNQNPQIIKELLKKGANVNDTENHQQTPLMFAATYNSNPEIIKTLLKNGAKLESKDFQGYSAVTFAVTNRQYENAKVLLNAGAKLPLENIMLSENEKIYNDIALYKGAIKNGANVNKVLPTEEKDTPLIWATCSPAISKQVVKLLLDSGANVYAKDINGYMATDCDSPEKVQLIRNHIKKAKEQKQQAKRQKLNNELQDLEGDKLF